jgi:uncharacterized protein DUF2024
MKIAVYDTYVHRPDGRVMHFDILVPDASKDIDQVLRFGRRYLTAKDVPAESLRAQECRFCHMESASEPVQAAVDQDGFAIIELDHCD